MEVTVAENAAPNPEPAAEPNPPATPAPAPTAPDPNEAEKTRRRQAAETMLQQAGAVGMGMPPPIQPTKLEDSRPARDAGSEPFEREQWGPYARFQCAFCPWDTLSEELAWDHYGKSHYGALEQRAAAARPPAQS